MNALSRRGERTRNAILNVARRLFSDFGYHHTGIADIQAATGLTKGAFYHHFRAKHELALAVLEMVRGEYGREVFEPAMQRPTPGGQLACVLDRLVELNATPEWRNCRLLVALSTSAAAAGDDPVSDEVRGLLEDLLGRFDTLVGAAQESGEAVKGPIRAWSQLVLGTCLGLVLITKAKVSKADHAAAVSLVKQAILQARRPALPGLVVGAATDTD